MKKKTLRFPYEPRPSRLFDHLYRPVALVEFYSRALQHWIAYTMIVDTGADYTILPLSAALHLGVSLGDCERHTASGIGGSQGVYLHRSIPLRIGPYELTVPVGFVQQRGVPPLLGRYRCLDTFDLRFRQFVTSLGPF